MDNNKTVAEMEARAKFFSKLSRITGSVRNIKKDATNKFHKYDYVSADGVLQTIAPLMAEENIALISETLEVGIDDKVYMPKYRFTFVCGDTGYMLPCDWYGETVHTTNKGARDDKALNKSATIAQKYFLLKTFLIATGDDPDNGEGDTGKRSARWATTNTITPIMEKFRDEGLTDKEIFRLAGVRAFNDGDGWGKYKNAAEAVEAIGVAFDHAVNDDSQAAAGEPESANGDRPEVYACEFTHSAYQVAGKKCVMLANCDPMASAGNGVEIVMAKAFGRSTEFKVLIGDYAYEMAGLARYDDVKKTTKFEPLPDGFSIELEYVEKTIEKGRGKGTTYKEIIGVVGMDSSQNNEQPLQDYDDIPF